ncbi:hypothetical protein [Sneathiella litorea]|uniref:VWA domain-containing protein n=1 Tax=Sneathiella litorea TaxID=2606216 RepID=A0A6L8WD45_9PROT|nr:hypothetical protein [Sneathiella litorea]MZR32360.1 hypothetical protein [Sneathiella litorea]
MRRRNRTLEIFSISFLDLVSCGFGAVVLLILISKPGEGEFSGGIDEARDIMGQITRAERLISDLEEQTSTVQGELSASKNLVGQMENTIEELNQEKSSAERAEAKALDDLEGLQLVEESLNRASIRPSSRPEKRDDEVGGIPVDSDYVLFIVDTSGSMQRIWGQVSRVMQNVLAIHPKVKGFQIMNDNGVHLISSYNGKWIPDTPSRRKNIFDVFAGWRSNSNSSPVEGLEIALQRYAKPGISLSIYILGDDYSGSSYDTVIDRLERFNTNRITGKPLARIHAIGILSGGTTDRFGILMREVTRRSNGTFLALPRQ